jgi:ABC-type microcin C transport system duplicated ATPase subunit YejF
MIAIALARRPILLIADEPTAAMENSNQVRGNNVTGKVLAPFGGISFYRVTKNATPEKNTLAQITDKNTLVNSGEN